MRLRRGRQALTADDVDARVLALVQEVRPPVDDHVVVDTTDLRNDLGMDSLAAVALAFRFEEELGIDYVEALELAQDIATVAELKAAVRMQLGLER